METLNLNREPPQPLPAAPEEDERDEAQSLPALEVLPTHNTPKGFEEAPAMRDGSRLPVGIIRIILKPVDWLFVFLGPRYGPYLMFFRVARPGWWHGWDGSAQFALQIMLLVEYPPIGPSSDPRIPPPPTWANCSSRRPTRRTM